jgi:hypothetical protein
MSHKIDVGDRVYECIKWKPEVDYKTRQKLGKGIVTLIIRDNETEERKMRVAWEQGVIFWHPENDLVNVKNVFKVDA